MKLLITGSRKYNDAAALAAAIQEAEIIMSLAEQETIVVTEILHGGAKGADQLASDYAKKYQIPETEIKPNYQQHHPKAAPLVRNSELVKLADMTLALYAGTNRKGGTWDAAKKTTKAGKHLLERMTDGETVHTAPAPTLL